MNTLDKDYIDENIIPILLILNMKGYKTLFSCGGHSTKEFTNIYIYFVDKLNDICPPKDFKLSNNNTFGSIIRYIPEPHNEKDIEEHMKILKEWSTNLCQLNC